MNDEIKNRIESESPYARACAVWVSRQVGENPDDIYSVDLCVREGYSTCHTCNPDDYGSFDTGPELVLEYCVNGRWKETYFSTSPGLFVEQCVEIMRELGTL